MVAVPPFIPVTTPFSSTVATSSLSDDHVTLLLEAFEGLTVTFIVRTSIGSSAPTFTNKKGSSTLIALTLGVVVPPPTPPPPPPDEVVSSFGTVSVLPGSTGLSPAVTPVVPSPAVTEAPGTFTSTLFALAITLSTVPSPLISTLLAFTLIVLTDEFSSIIMLEFSPC